MNRSAVLDYSSHRLLVQKTDMPKPQNDEVLIKNVVLGLNTADIADLYDQQKDAMVMGHESIGQVVENGPNSNFTIGQQVICIFTVGAFAEYRCVPKNKIVALPKGIRPNVAAASMFKGALAHVAAVRAFITRHDMSVIIQNAGSATGQAMCALMVKRQVKVVGLVKSAAEQQAARKAPYSDIIISSSHEETYDYLMQSNNNKPYHGLFYSYSDPLYECIHNGGIVINYGYDPQNSPSIDIAQIKSRSLFFTAPSISQYKTDKRDMILTINEVAMLIEEGILKPGYRSISFQDINDGLQSIRRGEDYDSLIVEL